MTLIKRLEKIQKILEDNKAEDVAFFDLSDTQYLVNGVVIATAMAQRHLDALSDFVRQEFSKKEVLHVEKSDEWIVLDLADILVHVMTNDARQKYSLDTFLNEFGKKS